MSQQGEVDWGVGAGDVTAHVDRLRSLRQEVQDPVTQGCVESQQPELPDKFLGDVVVLKADTD